MRRKTLRNTLMALCKSKDLAIDDVFARRPGIDPKTRAEQVDVAGFLRLTRAIFAGGLTRLPDVTAV